MSDQRTEQADTAPQAHIDAVVRAYWPGGPMTHSLTEARRVARAVLDSTDPAVHAALLESVLRTADGRALALDALTRHGVLTPEWIHGLHSVRRLVTGWEPTP